MLKEAIRTRKLIKQKNYKGPMGYQGPSNEVSKTFVLNNKAYEAGDYDEDDAAKETRK